MPALTLLRIEDSARALAEMGYSARMSQRMLSRVYPTERFNCLDVNLYVWTGGHLTDWFCIGYCRTY
jgi:hypothetical protein